MMKQEPPFAVQVELTEGCNLRCPFCAINGIRGKEHNYKFMTMDTARAVAGKLAEWSNPRLEFAMHGEPSMNANAERILAVFRAAMPKAPMMMLSNGSGFMSKFDRIDAMFEAGLDTLGFDEYQQINFIPKLMERLAARNSPMPFRVHVYPDDPEGNPHQRKNWKRLIHIRPIDLMTKGTHSVLNNHAGVGAPPSSAADGKRCAKPFREMAVRWDGSVAVCCNDWRGVLPCGNLVTDSLDDVWNSPAFQAARKALYHGMRDFGPCKGCDALSYRTGWLPDKKGKASLEPPTKEDREILERAIARGPLTSPVKRPWEI